MQQKLFTISYSLFTKKTTPPSAPLQMEGNVQLTYLQANKLGIISKFEN